MPYIASISVMQKFQFGQSIRCSDGQEGRLAQVVFDAASHRMTALDVKFGHVFKRSVYVSFDTVVSVIGDGITLRISRADLAALGSEVPTGVLLDSKSVVETDCRGAIAVRSTIRTIAVHPESGELAYLVAHHLRPGQDTLLPGKYVTQIAAGCVKVALLEGTLQSLPQYHSDRELQQEVEERLYDLTPFHIDSKGMNIRVLDGILHLAGNTSSSLRSDIVQDQVMDIEGLLEIKSELIGDDTLASGLAMALGHDSRTCNLPIGIYPRLGNVRLSGSVHNEQQKTAAGEIAHTFPGVRSVTNTLVVNLKEAMLHAMSSAEGGLGEDRIPGKYIRHTT
jgi:osmotically-inducible protein OsmY